jgi:hypothetical protein
MQNAPMRMNNTATCKATRAKSVQARSRDVRRQLMHLSSVYQGSSPYYREALRPVIRKLLERVSPSAPDVLVRARLPRV